MVDEKVPEDDLVLRLVFGCGERVTRYLPMADWQMLEMTSKSWRAVVLSGWRQNRFLDTTEVDDYIDSKISPQKINKDSFTYNNVLKGTPPR